MKAPKFPRTLHQVRKEMGKVYVGAAYVRDLGDLERLQLMKNALQGQVNAAAVVVAQSRLAREPLPRHWRRFIRKK